MSSEVVVAIIAAVAAVAAAIAPVVISREGGHRALKCMEVYERGKGILSEESLKELRYEADWEACYMTYNVPLNFLKVVLIAFASLFFALAILLLLAAGSDAMFALLGQEGSSAVSGFADKVLPVSTFAVVVLLVAALCCIIEFDKKKKEHITNLRNEEDAEGGASDDAQVSEACSAEKTSDAMPSNTASASDAPSASDDREME